MSHGVPHEAQHAEDTLGKKVGLLAALPAIGFLGGVAGAVLGVLGLLA